MQRFAEYAAAQRIGDRHAVAAVRPAQPEQLEHGSSDVRILRVFGDSSRSRARGMAAGDEDRDRPLERPAVIPGEPRYPARESLDEMMSGLRDEDNLAGARVVELPLRRYRLRR